jgi:hypothetical protein
MLFRRKQAMGFSFPGLSQQKFQFSGRPLDHHLWAEFFEVAGDFA